MSQDDDLLEHQHLIITEVVSPMVSGQYLSDFSMTDTELSPDSEYEST